MHRFKTDCIKRTCKPFSVRIASRESTHPRGAMPTPPQGTNSSRHQGERLQDARATCTARCRPLPRHHGNEVPGCQVSRRWCIPGDQGLPGRRQPQGFPLGVHPLASCGELGRVSPSAGTPSCCICETHVLLMFRHAQATTDLCQSSTTIVCTFNHIFTRSLRTRLKA